LAIRQVQLYIREILRA